MTRINAETASVVVDEKPMFYTEKKWEYEAESPSIFEGITTKGNTKLKTAHCEFSLEGKARQLR